MSIARSTALAACAIALCACGSEAPAPAPEPAPVSPPPTSAPPTSAADPPPSTVAPTAPYELHEWGVIDVPPPDRSDPIEIAAGAGRRVRPIGGIGFRKPVVYAHLLDGATEQPFALRVAIPSGTFVEHFPPGAVDGTTLAWPDVTARAEHCATPATGFVPDDERPHEGAAVPEVHAGTPDVVGHLARDIVERVVRRHVNEVRFCYEQELVQRPDLDGRVMIAFIVDATGAVQTANAESSTLNDPRVENCISQAVRRWTFPAPDDGVVSVNMPFELRSPDSPLGPARCTTADHVCETHELPTYDAASAACLSVGTRHAGLLFYRATTADVALPLRATRDGQTVTVSASESMEGAPGELVRITLQPGRHVVVSRAPFPASGASVSLPVGTEELTHERGVADLRASLSALGMDDDEASAFVAAWADDLLPPTPHHLPAGLVPGPRYHDALVFFLPTAALDALATLSATPAPRALRRAFMVRYDFGELPHAGGDGSGIGHGE